MTNLINTLFTSFASSPSISCTDIFSMASSASPIILVLACFALGIAIVTILLMPMPGVRCPSCLARGVEQWVMPGKNCPKCAHAC